MPVTVKVLGTLREVLGHKELALDFGVGTIADVIELLSVRCAPKIKTELLDEHGNLDLAYVILAGNRRLTSLADEVRDGDEIVIMNVIAGGSLRPIERGGLRPVEIGTAPTY